jgi:hypothetical protein
VAVAQFAAPGSQWHYTQCTSSFPYSCGPVQVNVVGQTIVNGIPCSNLQIAPFTCVGFNYLPVYQSHDTIYRYLYNVNTFTMLYDFNAQPGDTWNIVSNNQFAPPPAPLIDSVLIHIDSVSTIQINNQTRKIFFISYADPSHVPFSFEGPIVEGIGSLNFLLPQFYNCDPQTTTFRCFQDSVVGLYQPNVLIGCDSVIAVGEDEINRGVKFTVSPNPFTDQLCIHADNYMTKRYAVSIVNAMGVVIKKLEKTYSLNQQQFDLSFLAPGVYFLVVGSDTELVQKKIVKL